LTISSFKGVQAISKKLPVNDHHLYSSSLIFTIFHFFKVSVKAIFTYLLFIVPVLLNSSIFNLIELFISHTFPSIFSFHSLDIFSITQFQAVSLIHQVVQAVSLLFISRALESSHFSTTITQLQSVTPGISQTFSDIISSILSS
jgi:hypothetical protein